VSGVGQTPRSAADALVGHLVDDEALTTLTAASLDRLHSAIRYIRITDVALKES
jgi:hypothetical protein